MMYFFFFFFWIHKCDMIKGMSWMSGILSLSYKLKEVTNQKGFFFVVKELQRIVHISATIMSDKTGFRSKCSISSSLY